MLATKVSGLEQVTSEAYRLPNTLEAGFKVVGEAVARALVWEWGSVRIHNPGPKTTWGQNPAGEPTILTITAPQGYIWVNHDRYEEIFLEEYGQIDWSEVSVANLEERFSEMMHRAVLRSLEVARETAPEDTGLLKDSIIPAEIGDSVFQE